MTKFGLIIPICIIAASGCALHDGHEVTTETSVVSLPVVEGERMPPLSEIEFANSQPSVALIRPASTDDIRRLQMRLRELSFDPGPVDGVAGAKTKAAFQRLQAGCEKLEPLSEKLPLAAQETVAPLNRNETTRIQSQLRSAGFDPGPVDGIFGNRTKSVVSQVQSGCLMARDLNGRLEMASGPTKKEFAAAPSVDVLKTPATQRHSMGFARTEWQKNSAAIQPARSQEEIRILQLRLRDAGFDPGPFDGVLGQKTKSALQQYEDSQRNKKVKTSLTTSMTVQY